MCGSLMILNLNTLFIVAFYSVGETPPRGTMKNKMASRISKI